MKRTMSFVMIFLSVLMISACSMTDDDMNTQESPEGEEELLETKEKVIGFSAMSSVNALNTMKDIAESPSIQNQTNVSENQTITINDTQEKPRNISDIEDNLYLVNTFMDGENDFGVEILTNESENYEYTMLINSVDMLGEEQIYTFHYNENFEEESEDEEEYDSIIEGVMIVDGVSYDLHGEHEVEEDEESFEMTAKSGDNVVVIEYEYKHEDDDGTSKEFKYSLFKDEELFKYIEIEFEEEEDEVKMELKSIEGTFESEYEFEREQEGNETKIKIEYKSLESGDIVDEGEIEILTTIDEEGREKVLKYEVEEEESEDEESEDESEDESEEESEDESEDESEEE